MVLQRLKFVLAVAVIGTTGLVTTSLVTGREPVKSEKPVAQKVDPKAEVPKEVDVKFETVIKRDGGGPKQAGEIVIRTEKEWAAFAETFWLGGFKDELLKMKFDFDKEVVVAVMRGGSESVATKEDGVNRVRRTGDTAVVEWTVVESDQRESANSYPFHVIKMPKVKEVKFKKTEKTIGG